MQKDKCTWRLLYAVVIASLGGFLFGYHTAVISGALIFLTPAFHLTLLDEGLVVSIILMGALVGALAAGSLADFFGRKKTLLFAALLFATSAILSACTPTYDVLLIARVMGGFAVGIVSLTSPLYLAEISPPRYRGACVCMNQLATTVGILAAYLINLAYAHTGNWRMMFAVGALPALVQLVGGIFLPESRAWLEKAHISAAQGRWKNLLCHPLFRLLVIGMLLNAFQQITGINTVIYYAPKIFNIAGFVSSTSAIAATVGIGTINVLATILSVWLLDKWGRRPLLLLGVSGMIVSLLALSLAFFTESQAIDKIAVISLMGYVACFAIGLGPITALVLSEIYPLAVRGKAMAIATAVNWLCNYLVSLTFLDLMKGLGGAGVFCLYAGIGILALVFIWWFIPETKGKSLEQIEKELMR